MEDGTHTIKLTVYDKVGNRAEDSVVVVDNTLPDVNWMSPSSRLSKLSYLWNTTEVADGEHILTLRVLDRAGNGHHATDNRDSGQHYSHS